MRVAEFRRDEETKVGIVLDDAVAELHTQSSALFERLLQQQRLQQWINLLANILQKHWCTKLNAVLQRPDKVQVGHLDDVKVVWLLHVLDPLVRLTLWINH